MLMGETSMAAYLRPLSMTFLERDLPANLPQDPPNVALQFLGDVVNDRNDPLTKLRTRYDEVTNEAQEPFIVPDHPEVMRHVIRPLVEAKQTYVLGMPVACIALAGLVGEMVAIWRFRMMQLTIHEKTLDEELKNLLLGTSFDKLGQERRIDVLRAIGDTDKDTHELFSQLRGIRRAYMHFMVDEKRNPDSDARTSLRCAAKLVKSTLGVTYSGGKIVLPTRIEKYVANIMKTSQEPSSPSPAGATS